MDGQMLGIELSGHGLRR